MVIARIDNIGLAVRDLTAAADFFERQLGLTVERSPDAGPPSAVVHVGDQYLYVFQTGDDADGARRSAELTGNPRGLDHVSFTVDDVDAAYRALRDRGVAFASGPATVEEWGIRTAHFHDPEGNSLFLVQTLANAQ